MSLWRPERTGVAGIGIGAQAVYRCDAAGNVVGRQPLPLSPAISESEKAQQLTTALRLLLKPVGAKRTPQPRIVVADSLARYWMMESPAAVRSLSELQAVAQARSQQLFGVAQRWQVAADWSARHAFLCAAIPEWVGQGVRQVVGAAAPLDAVLPLVRARALGGVSDAWMCVSSPGRIGLLLKDRGRLRSVRALPSNPAEPLEMQLRVATQELRRESLRTQIPLGNAVPWWHVGGQSALADALTGVEVDGLRFMPQINPARFRRPDSLCSDAEAAAAMAAAF